MNVSIVVATFGSEEWAAEGHRTSDRARASAGAFSVVNVHLVDGTLAEARNLGAEDASGDWLCFLDADDDLGPGYLEAMERAFLLSSKEKALLAPAVAYVGRRGQRKPARIPPKVDLRHGNWLVIGTLVQREVFIEVGGFREWPIYEDWCLWQRCWKAGAEPVEVPEAHYVARVRPESRNRGPSRAMKLRYHHEIAAANFPA